MSIRPGRRRFLKAVGAVGTAGLAGCTAVEDGLGDPPGRSSGGWPRERYDDRNTAHNPAASGPREGTTAWRVDVSDRVGLVGAAVDGSAYVGSTGDTHVRALSTADGSDRWTYATAGSGATPPTVVDGTVYVGSGSTVYALDPADGTELWTTALEDESESDAAVGIPGTVGDAILAYGSGVYALDPGDGSVRWRRTLGTRLTFPAVTDSLVCVAERGRPSGGTPTAWGLSPDDGSTRWRTRLPSGRITGIAVGNGTAYACGQDPGTVFALSAADGDERWRTEPAQYLYPPAVTDDAVYVGGGVSGESGTGVLAALSPGDGSEQWTVEHDVEALFAPTTDGRTVYAGGIRPGSAWAFDAGTGERLWRIGSDAQWLYPPLLAGERAFLGSYDPGVIYAVE